MILLPTLNRIDGLTRFFKSWRDSEDTCPGLVLVDQSDFDSKKSTYLDLKHDYMPENWDYRVTKGITMGDKSREVWDEVQKYDWLGILNDDHYIVTPHACERLVKQLTGKNFISCNDLWNAPARVAGLTAWSMPLLKLCGFPMFPEGLQHLFIDDLWRYIGDHTGCWDIDMKVVIEHRHVFKRESPLDSTHQKTYSKAAWALDQQVFQKFMTEEMPALVKRVDDFVLDVTQARAAHG